MGFLLFETLRLRLMREYMARSAIIQPIRRFQRFFTCRSGSRGGDYYVPYTQFLEIG